MSGAPPNGSHRRYSPGNCSTSRRRRCWEARFRSRFGWTEKVEVDALICLQDLALEQTGVAAVAVLRRLRRLPGLAAALEFVGLDQQLETPLGNVEADAIAGLHQGQRSADRGFRRHMQHDGAERRAAHAGIR